MSRYSASRRAFGPAERRATWMKDFESLVVQWRPACRGRIDWDTAAFLFNTGNTTVAAATKYTADIPAPEANSGEGAYLVHVNGA